MLTWSALVWLSEPGVYPVGSAHTSAVPLGRSEPPHAGDLHFDGHTATFIAAAQVTATVEGRPITRVAMRPDTDGAATVVTVGACNFYLVRRAGQLAVRVRDSNAAARANFRGRHWYPPDDAWRLEGRFEPADAGSVMATRNVGGDAIMVTVAGYVELSFDGSSRRLVLQGDGSRLQLVFRDTTAGRETYAACRFLYPRRAGTRHLICDFNRAIHPPCAFTPHATCPLPPPENLLPFPIRAGERLPP